MIERIDSRPPRGEGARITRTPPYSEEAEMAVLGSVLLDGDVLSDLVPLIKEEDFYVPAHQQIYRVLLGMYDRGLQIDPLLVFQELQQSHRLRCLHRCYHPHRDRRS